MADELGSLTSCDFRVSGSQSGPENLGHNVILVRNVRSALIGFMLFPIKSVTEMRRKMAWI